MKKMQYNALNIKSVAKQVWFYFLRGTTRPGYAVTITNLQIVLNTPNPYLNQATPPPKKKNACQKKIPKSKISNSKKSFDQPCQLKSGLPPQRWVGHNVPTREISAVETNLSFVFQNVYKQISSLFTKHFEWTHLSGRHVLSRWQGIMGFLVFSPPRYAVPVLDTLCLSSLRCGCLRYAVLVLDTLRLS